MQRCDGRLWELAPWLEGQPERNRPPDEERVQAAFQALARLHRRLAGHATVGRSPGLAKCIVELEQLDNQGYHALESALHQAPASELRDAGLRWLALAQATAPGCCPDFTMPRVCPFLFSPAFATPARNIFSSREMKSPGWSILERWASKPSRRTWPD